MPDAFTIRLTDADQRGNGLAGRHQHAVVQRKPDAARTIQRAENMQLCGQRQIAVARAEARPQTADIPLECIAQAFDAFCTDGLHHHSLRRSDAAVSGDQTIDTDADGGRKRDHTAAVGQISAQIAANDLLRHGKFRPADGIRQHTLRFGSDPRAMKQAGIAYATDQIIDLYANGVNNVHVYSMNKPDVARKIQANVSAILGKPL